MTRILVVDDDPIVARALCRVLAKNVVVVAYSGAEAIDRLREKEYDLVLCDLSMPGMSGMEFYQTVRAISAVVAERIVFMTGGAFTSEGQEFLSALPNTWLEKPFDFGALLALAKQRAVEI